MSYYRALIQRPTIPYLTNLVGYYPFNANANDFSGIGNNGTVVGTPTYSAGKVGNAINFGNNANFNHANFIDYNDFSFTNGTNDVPFTISIWVNVTSFASTVGNWLFNKRGDSTNKEYQLYILSDGRLFFNKFSLGSNSGTQEIYSTTVPLISINTWYNIIVTDSGSGNINDCKIYLNGSLLNVTRTTTGTYVRMLNTTSNARAGNAAWATSQTQGTSTKHRGLLDEMYIWKNREMTATEALDIYNKGIAGIALI